MSRSHSAALPIAYVLLRMLVLLNWLTGAAILLLLVIMPNERWIMSALDLSPGAEAARIVTGLRAVAAIGLITVPINHLILQRLLAMVETLRAGDPFVADNADRLNAIAWLLLALQLIGLVITAIGESISSATRPIDLDAGVSLAGWLAVLLTFVLARVFAEGTLMREDLRGTV